MRSQSTIFNINWHYPAYGTKLLGVGGGDLKHPVLQCEHNSLLPLTSYNSSSSPNSENGTSYISTIFCSSVSCSQHISISQTYKVSLTLSIFIYVVIVLKF